MTRPDHIVNRVRRQMPADVTQLAGDVAAAGGELVIAGGLVRDAARGTDFNDWDVVIFGLPDHIVGALASRLGPVNTVGAAFGIRKVGHLDIALPRTDSLPPDAHPGDIAASVNIHLRPEHEAARRDFTINSMLLNPLTGVLYDPHGGLADVDAGILRVTNPAQFGEDPLRVLRAVSFAGRFNLTCPPDQQAIIAAAVPALAHLPRERSWAELVKLFTKSERPATGLRLGLSIGAFTHILPSLPRLAGVPQKSSHHPEGDALEHTLQAVDAAAAIATRDGLDADARLILTLAACCHDFGKADTYQHNLATGADPTGSNGHPAHSARRTRDDLTALRAPARTVDVVTALAAEHMWMAGQYRPGATPPTDAAIRRLAKRLNPATIDTLTRLYEADSAGRNNYEQVRTPLPETVDLRTRVAALGAAHGPAPDAVTGRMLIAAGLKPGRHFADLIAAGNTLVDNGATPAEAVAALAASHGAERTITAPAAARKPHAGRTRT